MALGIERNGIVQRHKDGVTTIWRPGRNGGPGTEIEVTPEHAEQYRLATGDIVAGETEIVRDESHTAYPHETAEAQPEWDADFEEPQAVRPSASFGVPAAFSAPTERLTEIRTVNGLNRDDAADRPFPRTQRSRSERTPPDRWLSLAAGPDDATGRTLDFAAPLGIGVFGIVYGPHGSGLTRTLQTVLKGLLIHAPDCILLVLLLRARAEETTEWHTRFPQADIVVGSSSAPEETLLCCELMLEAAQRQTELGRDVVLLIDSLTALWGTLLEAEEADAQQEADTSQARQTMREWTQKAGCFHGETPLGGGLGGSLTILGTVWHQAIDVEAEEERDIHPHLRLLEHVLPEAAWQIALSDTLMRRRLFPTIDVKQCRSQYEERLWPAALVEPTLKTRGMLPRNDAPACYARLQATLYVSQDLASLLEALSA